MSILGQIFLCVGLVLVLMLLDRCVWFWLLKDMMKLTI